MAYSFLTNHHFYDFNELIDHLEVQPGHTVLDLGCGHHGYWTFPMAQMVGRTGQVQAIDILPGAVNSVRRKSAELKLPQINSLWLDLENLKKHKLPLADVALLVNTLNQIKKRPKLFTALGSLVKPQGKLLIIDWKSNNNPYGPLQEHRVLEDDLKKWSKRVKFDVLKEFYLDDDHFAKILVKA